MQKTMMMIGKSTFESKDKTRRLYKVTVLEPVTAMQRGYGRCGYNAVDYFIDGGTYGSLPDNYDALPFADFEFTAVNGKAEVVSIMPNKPADKSGK